VLRELTPEFQGPGRALRPAKPNRKKYRKLAKQEISSPQTLEISPVFSSLLFIFAFAG
jgi:hypothetical protein